jgi:hypothetical protein
MNIDDFNELIYNSETGLFYRKANHEKVIGTINQSGYVVFRVKGKLYYAHRIAFFISFGFIPSMVDHINRNRSDNKLINLREADATLNAQNSKGYGVTKPKQTKKWSSAITNNRKRIHLGYFDTAEQAHKAYCLAKQKYHPNAQLELGTS